MELYIWSDFIWIKNLTIRTSLVVLIVKEFVGTYKRWWLFQTLNEYNAFFYVINLNILVIIMNVDFDECEVYTFLLWQIMTWSINIYMIIIWFYNNNIG